VNGSDLLGLVFIIVLIVIPFIICTLSILIIFVSTLNPISGSEIKNIVVGAES
jgi:hypothetical protein